MLEKIKASGKKKQYKILTLIALTAIAAACSDDTASENIVPENNAPTASITNIVSNDDTDTISGKVVANDSDGTITTKTLQAQATDGSKVTITINNDDTFEQLLTTPDKTYDTLVLQVTDNDGAVASVEMALDTPVTVEEADVASTVANPNNTVDENSTDAINLGVEDANGVASTVFKNESTNELATYFYLIDNTKLQVKTGAVLNHEVDSQIQGVITITDNLGNPVDKTITIDLNDVQEQQIIDLYGNGGLLPNGEAYAVKADEEATGETLPVDYYVSGTGNSVVRQSETDINESMPTAVYFPESLINGLRFDHTVPGYPNGDPVDPAVNQAMVSFDSANDEVNVLSSTGTELTQIHEVPYGKQLQHILDKVSPDNNSNNFRIIGTTENDALKSKIVADTKNPTQPNVNTDYAIKKKLTE